LALVFSFAGPEKSAIQSVIGNEGVLFLKDIDIISSSGGHCLNSLNTDCSGPYHYVDPRSWFHLVVVSVLFTVSYVTDWLLE
jgi:hypothetical protein